MGSPLRHRPWPFRALIAIAAAPFLLGTAPPPQDVSVTVTGVRSAKGTVTACLTALPTAFPNCKADPAARRLIVPAITGAVVLDFGQLASGRYAVSLIHDENSNGRLDTVLLIPREGYGFSRDARVRLGPPRFDSAAFEVDGQPAHLTVKMRYLF
jgi:uncharacterized protein (DUF2141 family)